jgi:hypothetical protein
MTNYIRRTLLPILDSLAAEEDNSENQCPSVQNGHKPDNLSALRGLSDSLAKLNLYGAKKKNQRPCPRYKKQINSPLSVSNVRNTEYSNFEETVPKKAATSNIQSNLKSFYEGSVLMNLGTHEPAKPSRDSRVSQSMDSLLLVGSNATTKDNKPQQNKIGEVLETFVFQPSANFCGGVRKYGGILGNMMEGMHGAEEDNKISRTDEIEKAAGKRHTSPNVRIPRKRVTVQSVLALSPSFTPLKRRDRKKTPMKIDEFVVFESENLPSDSQKVRVAGATSVFCEGCDDNVTKATSGSSDENIPLPLIYKAKEQENEAMTGRALFPDYNPARPHAVQSAATDMVELIMNDNVEATVLDEDNEGLAGEPRLETEVVAMNFGPNEGHGTLLLNESDVQTVSLTVDYEDATNDLLGLISGQLKEELGRLHSTPTSSSNPRSDILPVKYIRLTDDGADVSPLALGIEVMVATDKFSDDTAKREYELMEELEAINAVIDTSSSVDDDEDDNMATALLGHENVQHKNELGRPNASITRPSIKSNPVSIKYKPLCDHGTSVEDEDETGGTHTIDDETQMERRPRSEKYNFREDLEDNDSVAHSKSTIDEDAEDDMAATLLGYQSGTHKHELRAANASQAFPSAKPKLSPIKYKTLDNHETLTEDDNDENFYFASTDAIREEHTSTKSKSKEILSETWSVNMKRFLIHPMNKIVENPVSDGFDDFMNNENDLDNEFSVDSLSACLLGSNLRKQRNAMLRRVATSQPVQKTKEKETPSNYTNLAEEDEIFQLDETNETMSSIAEMSPGSASLTPNARHRSCEEGSLESGEKGQTTRDPTRGNAMMTSFKSVSGRQTDLETINAVIGANVMIGADRNVDEISMASNSPHSKLMTTKISQLIVECGVNAAGEAVGGVSFAENDVGIQLPPSIVINEISTPRCKSPKSKVMSLEYIRPRLPKFAFKDDKRSVQKLSDLLDCFDGNGVASETSPPASETDRLGRKRPQLSSASQARNSRVLPSITSRLFNRQREELTQSHLTKQEEIFQRRTNFETENYLDLSLENPKRHEGPKKRYRGMNRSIAKVPKPSRYLTRRSTRNPKQPDRWGFKPLSDASHRRNCWPKKGMATHPNGLPLNVEFVNVSQDQETHYRILPPSSKCSVKHEECDVNGDDSCSSMERNGKVQTAYAMRRSVRRRVQTERFGDFRHHDEIERVSTSTSDLESSNVKRPITNPAESLKVGHQETKGDVAAVTAPESESSAEQTTRKLDNATTEIQKQTDNENDNHRLNECWSAEEIESLQLAINCADARSSSFWEDVAAHLDTKLASECKDKWFSLVKTPAARAKKGKRVAEENLSLRGADDDAFDSTPMRGLLGHGFCLATPMFMSVTFEGDCSREMSADNVIATSLPTHDPSFMLGQRKGYKTYLQSLKRDMNRAVKDQTKDKPQKQEKYPNSIKSLWESIDDGEVDMNCRLTPGGTLRFSDHTELEEEIYFVGEEDDEDSE